MRAIAVVVVARVAGLVAILAAAPAHADACRSHEATPAQLQRCGEAALEAYNRDPTAPDADERLYDAGVAFTAVGSIAIALNVFTQLRRVAPASKLASRALARIGTLYAQVAMFDRAAETYEEYAKRYPGEKDAADALLDAIRLRGQLGQIEKAHETTQLFLKKFGVKRTADAATVHFQLAGLYEKAGRPDDAVRVLQEHLRKYGAWSGADRVVIAYAKIGESLWKKSCSVKEVDGACVRVVRERAVPGCKERPEVSIVVVPRDARVLREARAAFATAARQWESVRGFTGGDEAAARYFYARAKLAEANVEYEAFLAVPAPTPANVDTWMKDAKARRAKATAAFTRVLDAKDVASANVTLARTAQMDLALANKLALMPAPACTNVIEVIDALRESASLHAEACMARGIELSWIEDSCLRLAEELVPELYPPLRERRASPTAAPVFAVEAAMR